MGSVAAVCCYPQFIKIAKDHLPNNIAVATVVNFPQGQGMMAKVVDEVHFALMQGANEIDLVSRDRQMVKNVKSLCQDKLLKVIIESGELTVKAIYQISLDCLYAGADFIKTSTGKIAIGATPEAVKAILKAIKEYQQDTGKLKGLKVSGGVKTIEQAELYMGFAHATFGKQYLHPHTFRIGASSLLDALLSLHS